jgi:hypothetical protein
MRYTNASRIRLDIAQTPHFFSSSDHEESETAFLDVMGRAMPNE